MLCPEVQLGGMRGGYLEGITLPRGGQEVLWALSVNPGLVGCQLCLKVLPQLLLAMSSIYKVTFSGESGRVGQALAGRMEASKISSIRFCQCHIVGLCDAHSAQDW